MINNSIGHVHVVHNAQYATSPQAIPSLYVKQCSVYTRLDSPAVSAHSNELDANDKHTRPERQIPLPLQRFNNHRTRLESAERSAHCTHTEACYATPSAAQCLRRYCETAYSRVDVPNSIRSQRLVYFTPFPASSGRVQI